MSAILPFLQQAEDIAKGKMSETGLANSVLTRQQADAFMDLVVNESKLLQRVTTKRVNAPKGSLPKWDLPDIIVQGATATSTINRVTPQESVMTYDTEKYRLGGVIGDDFEEDNIEGSSARTKFLNMVRKGVANNVEYAALMSDDSTSVGDAQSDENNLLGVNDGWYKILLNSVPTAQIINCAGASSSPELYYEMKRRLPTKYRAQIDSYEFLMGPSAYDKVALTQYGRVTAAGDNAIATGNARGTWGITPFMVPKIPETLAISETGNSDGSFIILTPPENLVVYLQRDWRLEFQREIDLNGTKWAMHFRADFQVIDPKRVVLAYSIADGGTDYDRDA